MSAKQSPGWLLQARRITSLLMVVGVAACGGNASSPTTIAPSVVAPFAESTAEELAEIASSFRARLVRLQAMIGACHRDRCVSLEGTLLVARSGAFAARLTGPGGDVEMASDGRMLELRLGSAAEPEVHDALGLPSSGRSRPHLVLAPLDIADALLPQVVPVVTGAAALLVLERRPGEVALMLMAADPARLLRRIVFDPSSQEIRRIERFDDAGSLRVITTYEGWDPRRGPPSGHLQLSWPQRRAVLDITIGSVELEPSVDREAFRLAGPPRFHHGLLDARQHEQRNDDRGADQVVLPRSARPVQEHPAPHGSPRFEPLRQLRTVVGTVLPPPQNAIRVQQALHSGQPRQEGEQRHGLREPPREQPEHQEHEPLAALGEPDPALRDHVLGPRTRIGDAQGSRPTIQR